MLGCAPSILLIFKPTPKFFLYSLCISSLSFYLFSYQVHEKNILFALMPISLFILEAPYFLSSLAWISMFSMLPLLERDGLFFWYWVLNAMYYAITAWIQPLHTMQYKERYGLDDESPPPPMHPIVARWRLSIRQSSSSAEHNGEEHVAPFHYAPLFWCYQPIITLFVWFMTNIQWSEQYPHIGTYLIMIYCCAHFMFAWILFVLQYLLEYFGIFKEEHVILCNHVWEIEKRRKQKKS